jgi:hypothetical protein
MIAWFRQQFANHSMVRLLVDAPVSRERCIKAVKEPSLWLVLGYHPVLYRAGLSPVCSELSFFPALRDLWACAFGHSSEQFRIGVAWRNALWRHGQQLQGW